MKKVAFFTNRTEPETIKTIALELCLAKTVTLANGEKGPGDTVLAHCLNVGYAADIVAGDYFRIDGRMPLTGAALTAALHDIGKVSPGFQKKIYHAIGQAADINVELDLDRQAGYHTSVGQAALAELESVPQYVADIAGYHHGYSPHLSLGAAAGRYGGDRWQDLRRQLFAELAATFLQKPPSQVSPLLKRLYLGLTVVADWIASGNKKVVTTDSDQLRRQMAAAVTSAGFIAPCIETGLSFAAVFNGYKPRAAQTALIDKVDRPGLYILEAPMGEGKTEAALYAAYRALERGHCRGIYFALPTRLTSNKIHSRFNRFLTAILTADSPHRRALLSHGNAWLVDTILGEEGEPGQRWFNQGRRAILAPFAVGTLDQALMAVINVRHSALRLLGLWRKVVILDEVHSYDMYTGSLLDRLIADLVALDCYVIVLSATLSGARRRRLIPSETTSDNTPTTQPAEPGYPLLTAFEKESKKIAAIEMPAADQRRVCLRHVAADGAAIDEALERCRQGQQVLWIENSVKGAQNIYSIIAARSADDCDCEIGLLHSRFIQADREKNEQRWVDIYGKGGARSVRGRILIGTQVLEQSLDIDADFLVSRLAPSDMVLQRIGRLWRHRVNDSGRTANQACAWLLHPGYRTLAAKPSSLGDSGKIYPTYVLLRAAQVWESYDSVTLPCQIREIIEKSYAERREEGQLARFKEELRREVDKLRSLAIMAAATAGRISGDDEARTRYTELESSDLLLLRSFSAGRQGTQIVTIDGDSIFLPRNPDIKSRQHRRISAQLHKQIVRVQAGQTPPTRREAVYGLRSCFWLGNDTESRLAVGLVGHDRLVRGCDGSETRFSYDSTRGYYKFKLY